MASLSEVPSLDELSADPARATALPRATIQSLLHRCVGLQVTLLGALAGAELTKTEVEPDRMLRVDAAAARLGVSEDWLYRNSGQLPFTVREGRRQLRFSSHGIDRYIRERQGTAD